MMDLNVAFQGMSTALTALYRDRATIYGVTQEKGARGTRNVSKVIADNVPCKLSMVDAVKSGRKEHDTYTDGDYDAKLFLAHGTDVPVGATIDVTTVHGKELRFKRANKVFVEYVSHIEVYLTHFAKSSEVKDG